MTITIGPIETPTSHLRVNRQVIWSCRFASMLKSSTPHPLQNLIKFLVCHPKAIVMRLKPIAVSKVECETLIYVYRGEIPTVRLPRHI